MRKVNNGSTETPTPISQHSQNQHSNHQSSASTNGVVGRPNSGSGNASCVIAAPSSIANANGMMSLSTSSTSLLASLRHNSNTNGGGSGGIQMPNQTSSTSSNNNTISNQNGVELLQLGALSACSTTSLASSACGGNSGAGGLQSSIHSLSPNSAATAAALRYGSHMGMAAMSSVSPASGLLPPNSAQMYHMDSYG